MLAWGWRVPFLLALLPGALAALGRRCIPESGQFLEAQACQAAQPATSTEKTSRSAGRKALTKMRDLLSSYGPHVLVGLGSVASVSVLLYGGMTWGLVSLKKKGFTSSFRILAGCGANLLVVFLAPVVGLRHRLLWSCLDSTLHQPGDVHDGDANDDGHRVVGDHGIPLVSSGTLLFGLWYSWSIPHDAFLTSCRAIFPWKCEMRELVSATMLAFASSVALRLYYLRLFLSPPGCRGCCWHWEDLSL